MYFPKAFLTPEFASIGVSPKFCGGCGLSLLGGTSQKKGCVNLPNVLNYWNGPVFQWIFVFI